MNKLRVATIIGTRPEIIRLSRVMAKLDEHCDHVVIHTGQNYDYELNGVFFDQLGLRKPDRYLGAAGVNGAETIGNVIIAVDRVLAEVRPDAILVLGDTNSCLSVIPAKRRKIPIFHMEAGNRCFDMRVPEEINRRIVDHTADINLTYSEIARQYLLAEGLPPDRVIKTGSPMLEVLTYYRSQIDASSILDKLGLSRAGYFLVSAHREENIDNDQNFLRLIDTLNAVADRFRKPIIVSAHPRTRAKIETLQSPLNAMIQLHRPFGFLDYVRLQLDAHAVLSDSGTITEESSILGFPAVNLRETHERPEGMEEGTVMMTGLAKERVLQALDILGSHASAEVRTIRIVDDYNVRNVAEKVVRLIVSYTDYVNRVVWHRVSASRHE